MMRTRSGIIGARLATIVVLAATVMAWMSTTVSAEVIDRIVAQVNDEIITLYELEEAALPYLVQQGQDPRVLQDEARRAALLQEVLDDKIARILIEEEAARMEIEVTDAQIQEWMTMMARQQGMTADQFRQAVAQYGIDYESYRDIVRDNLLRMQMAQMRGGGAVTESDVDSVYRRRFGSLEETQPRIEVRHILLIPDQYEGGQEAAWERLRQMRDEIESGAISFGELAATESQGPGADQGGNIGRFSPGELATSFEEVAFGLEVGELTGPVETEFGYHLVEVLEREDVASPQYEQRRQQIRAELQEREMERQLDSFVDTLRSRAFVDVRY